MDVLKVLVRGSAQIVKGMIPLSEMFGYATTLRSATQGRGTFSMTFDHCEDVPESIAEEIIKKNGGNGRIISSPFDNYQMNSIDWLYQS